MDYIKFNCSDLAAQNEELAGLYRKLRRLYEDLTEVLGSLDPDVKGQGDLQRTAALVLSDAADVMARISGLRRELSRITDIYGAAEKMVLESVRGLPAGLLPEKRGPRGGVAANMSTSSISGGGLILEDWIYELMCGTGGQEL